MALNFVDQIELTGKNVVARFDFNVPLNGKEITDTTRIDLALDTISHILENGAKKLILMSHLGRPKGERKEEFSLEPVAKYLAEKLKEDVILSESAVDRGIKTLLGLNESRIILLENLRFHPEEEANDHEFAKTLASYGDIYINDAFGTAHRKHASTYQIAAFFGDQQRAGGFLLRKEIEALTQIVESPKSPFIAIVGGAKISDKIKIIDRLVTNVSSLLIGGAMAYPFLKAKGFDVGTSLCSDEDVKLAKRILSGPGGHKIAFPIDHIVSSEFGGVAEACDNSNIPEGKMGLDIGPKTLAMFNEKIRSANTILWNGPMGIFENKDFNKGTFGIAESLSISSAFTLVGGGDSVSAVKQAELSEKMSHVSTGGGASLEFIEQGNLPGIQALKYGVSI